jgi:ABC-type branched-subunit amino acid transport system ATPase component/ABC-type branched-subunit amino acid transport system permease subunit
VDDAIRFALLGLGTGATYALLAQGVVLIHRGSGVLNFAQGAFAMIGTMLFADLYEDREWALAPSIAVSVAAVAVLGGLTHLLVMRRLRSASPVARVIATLGLLIVLQEAARLRWGGAFLPATRRFLPDDTVEVAGANVGADRFVLLGVVTVTTVLLWVIYRSTPFGLATTAVAENERSAMALGWSPDLIATANWTIGGALAGLAGVLLYDSLGRNITQLTLLVTAALAAALIGGFHSFVLTYLGAVVLGMAVSEVTFYQTKVSWLAELPSLQQALPFVVIVVWLGARGRTLPVRGQVSERFPALGTGIVLPAIVVPTVAVLLALVWLVLPTAWDIAVTTSLVAAVIYLSIVVLTGYAGQLSLGQFALAGFGALIAGRLVAAAGWPFELAALAGVVGVIPVGLVFAIPALRTRGVNLAVVTLGLGAAIQQVVFNNSNWTGGRDGTNVGRQTVLGIDVDLLTHPERYATLVASVFVVLAVAVANLRRSRAGRRLIAVRTNERAAAALGVNVLGAKLYAFSLSAAIAGLGGILLAFRYQSVLYERFNPFASITAVANTVIGGVGYVIGPLFGAQLATGGIGGEVGRSFESIDSWLGLIGGLLVVVFLVADPNGMASSNIRTVRHIRSRVVRRRNTGTVSETVSELHPSAEERVPVVPAHLVVSNVAVRFGGVVALADVSIDVGPREVVGLIGPNGAGKTTLVDAITGFVTPSAGVITLNGERIERLPAYRRARAGISRSFQSLELFEDITVRENLRAASDERDGAAYLTNLVRPSDPPLHGAAVAAVREFGLASVLDVTPADLPHGTRRLVAIARAVAASPAILLLDEPAAGLDHRESAELGRLVRRLADEWGIGILLIEHDMAFVMGVCDRVAVLDFGRKIAEGTPAEIQADAAVRAAYLGAPLGQPEQRPLVGASVETTP